ncbi:uncharacterized protein LOC111338354 isoform X2 [Stylophora pistillata]|uniref:uncharacterized protein LOC111338354 isoform X2 n=1 Tax=Stylophora pistillata TaxID=50429 RepID=UPI000C0550C0|nr:uncharacterized protein LOC111338354 isoform X2 [Stylophora pistillata]
MDDKKFKTGEPWCCCRQSCTVFLFITTLLYVYYFSCYMKHELRTPFHPPYPQSAHLRCRGAFKTLTRGNWERRNVSDDVIRNRRRFDMMLRERKGWPERLSHGDLRCGPLFPLPRKTRKADRPYVFDVQAQCDTDSQFYCCHGNTGWCGHGDKFCACSSCINYRSFISAELAQWRPLNGCQVRNFTQSSACESLSHGVSSVTFVGDSLVRHFFSAMVILLTNDPLYGALKFKTPPRMRDICKGDSQFVDSICHVHTAMTWRDIMDNPNFCNGWARFKISYVKAYKVELAQLALLAIRKLLNKVGSIVLMGIGIHNNFNASAVIQSYLEPAVQLVSTSRNGWPHLIWLSTHSMGPLKPINYHHDQGNPAILSFNENLLKYCNHHNITMFDSFNMTMGVHSFDGTHFGVGVNTMKVQILLNYLEEYFSR